MASNRQGQDPQHGPAKPSPEGEGATSRSAYGAAMTRCFLVGTARGGTTLLQSMLGAHPAVYTLPETHFWDYSLPKQPWLRSLKALLPGSNGADKVRATAFVQEQLPGRDASAAAPGVLEALERLPAKPLADPLAWTRGLFAVLDALAEASGRSFWLEKTPLHLYYTDLFRAADPSVRIVHMLRDPVDQVASLVDAGTKHGEAFRQGSVGKAWKRWEKEYTLQRGMIGKPGHAFVVYDDLVAEPEATLRPLLSFLGLAWNADVMAYREKASGVIASGEAWKDRNTGDLSKSNKAERVLRVTDREWLRRQALKYPLAPFREAGAIPPGSTS